MQVKTQKEELFGSIALGLVLLFAIISMAVTESSPKPKNLEQQQSLLEAHEAILYYFDAELMAKHLRPEPSGRWSRYILDDISSCYPLGNGVWYARGLVKFQPDSSPPFLPWEVCFLPGDQKPLFARVGDTLSGDLKAALRMAGHPDAGGKGAAGEK
jgi:hypothetical protein